MKKRSGGGRQRLGILMAAGGWVCGVVLFAMLSRSDLGATMVLLALGPLLVGLWQIYRQHRTILRRIDLQGAKLGQQLERLGLGLEQQRERMEELAESTARMAYDIPVVHAGRPALTQPSLSRQDLDQAVSSASVKAVKAIRKGMATDLLTTYRQLEALQNLYAMVPVDGPMPPTRVWACSPDLLLLLVNLIEVEKPSLIVECGSGTSTLWFALVLRRLGLDGQVVALEHQDLYVEKTRSMIERHGLGDLAEVRHVPLEPIQLGTETFQWYGRSGWVDLTDIDLLFVDGPPAATGRHARFPALPLLVKHLHPNGVTVLDDLVRTDEQEIVNRWLRDFPEYSAEYIKLEKNAALLRR